MNPPGQARGRPRRAPPGPGAAAAAGGDGCRGGGGDSGGSGDSGDSGDSGGDGGGDVGGGRSGGVGGGRGREGRATTIASRIGDFPEWHRGRPCYAVWAIALDDAAIQARLDGLRRALHGLLLPGGARQPHVTLQVCGFPAALPARPDDFGPQQLQAQLDALAGAAAFELHIGGAFSFVSAACLSVRDPAGSLARLRAAVEQAAPCSDATPSVPHVTAGLYAGAWPLREVRARLQPLRRAPPLRLQVEALEWMSYDSRHVAGPLRPLLRVDLAGGCVRVVDPDGLRAAFAAPAVDAGAARGARADVAPCAADVQPAAAIASRSRR